MGTGVLHVEQRDRRRVGGVDRRAQLELVDQGGAGPVLQPGAEALGSVSPGGTGSVSCPTAGAAGRAEPLVLEVGAQHDGADAEEAGQGRGPTARRSPAGAAGRRRRAGSPTAGCRRGAPPGPRRAVDQPGVIGSIVLPHR